MCGVSAFRHVGVCTRFHRVTIWLRFLGHLNGHLKLKYHRGISGLGLAFGFVSAAAQSRAALIIVH